MKLRNKDKHAKTNKYETRAQQKGKGKQTNIFSDLQQFHKLLSGKLWTEKTKEGKGKHTCVRNDKTRRERKRDNR